MRNSFIVKFGVGLWLTSMGVGALGATFLNPILCFILGSMLDRGILLIDLSLDSLKLAIQKDEYKALAKAAYDHAMARVYTEKEKDAIRRQYLDVIRNFITVGMSNNNNP